MTNELVLITGATGHLGFRILVEALKAGYSVRAAVRSQAKAKPILDAPSIVALAPGSALTFVTVPDITAEGAYDDAVKGVQYIIHCASPITYGVDAAQYESDIIVPALKGTLGILEAAHRTPGIKRVVVTSSVAAVLSPTGPADGKPAYDETDRAPLVSGPFESELHAYGAAKVRAFRATQDFIEREKPAFDLISVLPTFLVGRNELVTNANDITKGSNGVAFGAVLGNKSPVQIAGQSVHVDDAAKIHVLSLDPAIVTGHDVFLADSGDLDGTTWDDAKDIVARHFPDAVANGVLPNNGTQPTQRAPLDASKAERTFNIRFVGYEEQIKSVTQHYLDLVKAK
ncbi:MAG: hypothetical protein M1833_003173 [Piccolia ochrophora]|nr:MAG: hypothetical protein M1833_003173 [Piccolia ochrophora]